MGRNACMSCFFTGWRYLMCWDTHRFIAWKSGQLRRTHAVVKLLPDDAKPLGSLVCSTAGTVQKTALSPKKCYKKDSKNWILHDSPPKTARPSWSTWSRTTERWEGREERGTLVYHDSCLAVTIIGKLLVPLGGTLAVWAPQGPLKRRYT